MRNETLYDAMSSAIRPQKVVSFHLKTQPFLSTPLELKRYLDPGAHILVRHPPWRSLLTTVHPDVLKEVRVILQLVEGGNVEVAGENNVPSRIGQLVQPVAVGVELAHRGL